MGEGAFCRLYILPRLAFDGRRERHGLGAPPLSTPHLKIMFGQGLVDSWSLSLRSNSFATQDLFMSPGNEGTRNCEGAKWRLTSSDEMDD